MSSFHYGKKPSPSSSGGRGSYNQDRKYEHWLNVSPKNIAEKRAPDMGGMQGREPPMDWGKIEKENPNHKVLTPWEAEGDGMFGTQYDGRKPSYGEAGDTKLASDEKVGGKERIEHEKTESEWEKRIERRKGVE